MNVITTDHFAERVRERIAPNANPHEIAQDLAKAITTRNDEVVKYCCKLKNRNRAVYKFRVAQGEFFAVWDKISQAPITVLTAGAVVQTNNPNKKKVLT